MFRRGMCTSRNTRWESEPRCGMPRICAVASRLQAGHRLAAMVHPPARWGCVCPRESGRVNRLQWGGQEGGKGKFALKLNARDDFAHLAELHPWVPASTESEKASGAALPASFACCLPCAATFLDKQGEGDLMQTAWKLPVGVMHLSPRTRTGSRAAATSPYPAVSPGAPASRTDSCLTCARRAARRFCTARAPCVPHSR